MWPEDEVSDMGYEFTLVLDHQPSDDELDRLFVEGCSDAVFEPGGTDSLAHFTRKDDSLTTAISSAVHAIERAGFTTSEVRPDDIGVPSMFAEYAREIAAANMMVQTRAFLAGRGLPVEPSGAPA